MYTILAYFIMFLNNLKQRGLAGHGVIRHHLIVIDKSVQIIYSKLFQTKENLKKMTK